MLVHFDSLGCVLGSPLLSGQLPVLHSQLFSQTRKLGRTHLLDSFSSRVADEIIRHFCVRTQRTNVVRNNC